MCKREFGDLIHTARSGKNLSLRRLANLSGMDYSRLARIEHGTRPAPSLTGIRALADALDLDLGELLVAAGTSRSVMEDLVWSERIRLGHVVPDLGAYRPGVPRLLARNTLTGHVERRRGALCSVRVGKCLIRAFSFSPAAFLRLVIPPETVGVSTEPPPARSNAAATVLPARIIKVRVTGQLANLVAAADGCTLNALCAVAQSESLPSSGDSVCLTLLTAAISTTPIKEEA